MTAYNLRCIGDDRAELGEGPLWVAQEQALYWVDILTNRILRHCPADGSNRAWTLPVAPTCIVQRRNGGLAVTADCGLHAFDPATGALDLLFDLRDRPSVRTNDGSCRPNGDLWFGTAALDEETPDGCFYRLSPDGEMTELLEGFEITNGPVFDSSGGMAYLTDTLGQEIFAAEVENDGSMASLHSFASIPPSDGWPDGMAVDVHNCVWVAHFAGGRVTRFSPDGDVLETVALPVSNVTSLAFGGSDLRTLFITTARKELSPDQLRDQPMAGGLFACEVDTPGFLIPPFG